MTDPVALIAPIVDSAVIELGKGLYRKQVLREGQINYKGQKLDFSGDYLDGLALAFKEQAFDACPLVFADKDNAHTQDVERIRGDIIGFERRGNGLDAIVSVPDPKSQKLIEQFPKLGVSVRIEQPLDRADGKKWPAAIHHVLATANPRMTGLSPWEPVDLAVDGDEVPVIDLSNYDFAEAEQTEKEGIMPNETPKDAPLSAAENARLRELLANLEEADQGADDGYVMPSDEELAEMAAALFEDEGANQEEQVTVGLSDDTAAIELAAQVDAQAIELSRLRNERDVERYNGLVRTLAEDYGIPPRITELAKHLLTGTHVVELSSGGKVDAGETVLKVLKAIGEQAKLIDLSTSAPVFEGTSERESAAKELETRQAEAKSYASQFGLV